MLKSPVQEIKVVHCIWPPSISAQSIYREIIQKQPTIAPNKIFERAKFLDIARVLDKDTQEEWIEKHLWFTVLQFVFELQEDKIKTNEAEFSVSVFRQEKNLVDRYILFFCDEVPIKQSELYVIYNLRETIKRVRNLGLLLSGTNAKAASMISVSEATSVDDNRQPWALFVTRLPRFQLNLSNLA